LDVSIHELLMNGDRAPQIPPAAARHEATLPEPVFPQHPELLHANDEEFLPKGAQGNME
jgi:hypothetical protein